jgi:hypothetical protein
VVKTWYRVMAFEEIQVYPKIQVERVCSCSLCVLTCVCVTVCLCHGVWGRRRRRRSLLRIVHARGGGVYSKSYMRGGVIPNEMEEEFD